MEEGTKEQLIKELRQLNQEIKELEFYKLVLDQLPVCTIIYNDSGQVVYRNRSTKLIDGYDDDELLGLSRHDYLERLEIKPGKSVKTIHPNSPNDNFNSGIYTYNECTLRQKNGTLKTVLLNGNTIYDEENNFLGACGCALDITDYARTDRMFQLLADNARDIVFRYRLRQEPGFEYISPSCAAITGYAKEDFYADPEFLDKITHPADRASLKKHVDSPTTITAPVTARIIHKDGRLIWIELSYIIICDDTGVPLASEGIIRDITERKSAENALLYSEREKALILDSTAECILYHDPQMNIIWANKATVVPAGVPGEDLTGRLCHEVLQGRSAPCPGCPVVKALQTGLPQEGEVTTPDGRKWFVRGTPVLDEHGKITGIVEVAQDLNRLKLTEDALRESEERFCNTLKNSPIVVFNQDRELRYTWAYNTHGCETNELLGKTDTDIFTAEDCKLLTRIKARVMETGIVAREEVRLTIRGKVCYYDLSVEPLYEPDGKIAGVTCVAADITARKQTTEALRKSEEHFYKIFNLSPVLMSINILKDLQYLDVNESWQTNTGYSRDEILGRTPRGLDFPESTALMNTGQHNKKVTYYTKSGELRIGLTSAEIIEAGGQKCILSVTEDITELEQAELEMARLDWLNLVGQMAAGLGHEIRNPMATVRGFLQLLEGKEDRKEYAAYYGHMIGELDRANTIVNEFLSLAKDKPLRVEPQNLNDILRSLSPLLLSEAVLHKMTTILNLEDIPNLELDGSEIRQLILNLVRNGLEAMHPGGKITIRTFQEDGEVVLAIHDQGRGIEPALLEKLGTPFLSTKENGTGLSLPVCYRIAARHNAIIKVDSGPTGTTFFVRYKTA